MLVQLSVQNYALIDQAVIHFSAGLTIITGETGAGKSILMGALGLLIGQRADTQVLQDKSKKCIVEGVFDMKNIDAADFFNANELDQEHRTTIRREITADGKSRAFINDTPVTLAQLKELGDKLIDIHSQHQTLKLNEKDFQLAVIDAYAVHPDLLDAYTLLFKEYKLLQKKKEELVALESQSKRDLDYFQFQLNELEAYKLEDIQQKELEQELETLSNAEEIKQALGKSSFILKEAEDSILIKLNEVKALLGNMAHFNTTIQQLSERVQSGYIEMKDIAAETEQIAEDIQYDPQRIQEINETLDLVYRLQKKHGVVEVEDLIRLRDELSEKVSAISSLDDQLKKIDVALVKQQQKLEEMAGKISANRSKASVKIEKDVQALLVQLSMPNAQLKIENRKSDPISLNASGGDNFVFLFAANKGGDFKELNKVASGGELSRLMLSIKSLLSRLTALPTIIFDEIDTGVSGDVAAKVGSIMEDTAKHMQVIAITHLPQIASKGHNHLFVYKEDEKNKTLSRIKVLTKEERIEELAKMLSAGKPSAAAFENARELLAGSLLAK